jgi:hypothetical protein
LYSHPSSSFISKGEPIGVDTATIKDAIRGIADREIVYFVAEGIDDTLGTGSSKLVFKTLESAFDFKTTASSIKTGEFDALLPKVIGKIGYQYIVRSIHARIKTGRTSHHETP